MKKYVAVIVFSLLVSLFTKVEAQKIVVSGHAPTYAGTELIFMQYSNWITGTEEIIGTCKVADSGDFKIELPLNKTGLVFTYLGIYRCYFYGEPGKTYQLVLPDKAEKSPEDILNPYFEPVEIHLGLVNYDENELNTLILMFDDNYIPYYNKHVNDLYGNADVKRLDEDIKSIEKSFAENRNNFFNEYRTYRYGLLKLLANQQKVQRISDEYFNNQSVLYNNPAYGELFNKVFDKYFVFFGRTDEGKQIFDDINQKGSYKLLLNTLEKSTNFSNDTLTELVILKELFDEYYSDQFSRHGLLQILDSLKSSSKIEEHKMIAQDIFNKTTQLQAGYDPPQFELLDNNGNLMKLTDFKGKYVYLNFCTCQSYSCLNEFNMLSGIYQRFKDKLVIITIATDPSGDVLNQFLQKNKYNWTFLLYDNQPEILRDYDVRAYPTYFLIGPDGKLIFSPAASPSEDFESKFIELLRSKGELQ